MSILAHDQSTRLTFVLAMPVVPALPLALPDPRGELQKLVDYLALEVIPHARRWRWTSDGPGYVDHIHLGPRDQHFTITLSRGARYRGGACFGDGLTITAPDGSTRRYRLLMGKEALLRLLSLLRERYQAAEIERLRADLRQLLASWRGRALEGYAFTRFNGRIGQPGQHSFLTIQSDMGGTLLYPSPSAAYLQFAQTKRNPVREYGCHLPISDLNQFLATEIARHNAL